MDALFKYKDSKICVGDWMENMWPKLTDPSILRIFEVFDAHYKSE